MQKDKNEEGKRVLLLLEEVRDRKRRTSFKVGERGTGKKEHGKRFSLFQKTVERGRMPKSCRK